MADRIIILIGVTIGILETFWCILSETLDEVVKKLSRRADSLMDLPSTKL